MRVGGMPVEVAKVMNGSQAVAAAVLAAKKRAEFFGKKEKPVIVPVVPPIEPKERVFEDELIALKTYFRDRMEALHDEVLARILKVAKEMKCDAAAVLREGVTRKEIRSEVCILFRISINDINSQRRSREIVVPRHIAMSLMKNLTASSYPEIGQFFAGRDHTTVMYACKRMQKHYDMASANHAGIRSLALAMWDSYAG